ncbi:hypothetical protein ACFV5G_10115 [Streptomyces sp. NPDC059766]|uniref:hypothetical protein n=1 Tax=Streptomyces sp. NPDC059766 TaxID=3346940 RepID=UPI0036504E82
MVSTLIQKDGLDDPLPGTLLSGHDPGVRLTSVGGVDAAHLALYDIDLPDCRFAGAVHLDQLRVDGWCTFANTLNGIRWHQLLPRWWGQRSTLAEERHWRAQCARQALAHGWTPADTPVLQPAALAALYRQVRKSLEDGKNEPDAADFYYGEMEMRRHDSTRPPAERALLTAYWAVSGYGLRASCALAWLLGAIATTLLALQLWGFPAVDPKPTTTGRQVAVGQDVTLTTDTPDPVNPTGARSERVTTPRFKKALRVVINSVVFPSSGQDLTTAGTCTEDLPHRRTHSPRPGRPGHPRSYQTLTTSPTAEETADVTTTRYEVIGALAPPRGAAQKISGPRSQPRPLKSSVRPDT